MRAAIGAVLLLGCVGCAPSLKLPPVADGERIQIETDGGFCMGDCNWYRLQVTSDGTALVRVYHNNILLRTQRRRLTADAFAAFEARLAAYRPVGDNFIHDDAEHCEQFATDLGGYHVQWEGRGPKGRLILNDGCIGRSVEAMRAALAGAAASLGFDRLPGTSGSAVASTVVAPGKRGELDH